MAPKKSIRSKRMAGEDSQKQTTKISKISDPIDATDDTTCDPIDASLGQRVNQIIERQVSTQLKSSPLFRSLEEELTCGICLNILDNPVVTPCCRQSYCRPCIERTLQLSSNPNQCPNDKQPLLVADLRESALNVIKILNNEINCENESNGCVVKLRFCRIAQHLKACPFSANKELVQLVLDLNSHNNRLKDEIKYIKKEYETKCTEIHNNNRLNEPNGQNSTIQRIQTGNEELDRLVVLPIIVYPEHIMFGTYRTDVRTVELIAEGIKLTNVEPNSRTKMNFKYHVMIPFVDIKQVLYCTDPSLPILFVRTNEKSSDKIQECLNLGKESPNGFRFDINSNDSSEQSIRISLKKIIETNVIRLLTQSAQTIDSLECRQIDAEMAQRLMSGSKGQRVGAFGSSN